MPDDDNILQYVPKLRPREYIEDHCEVVMIVDCEEVRQLILSTGFAPVREKVHG